MGDVVGLCRTEPPPPQPPSRHVVVAHNSMVAAAPQPPAVRTTTQQDPSEKGTTRPSCASLHVPLASLPLVHRHLVWPAPPSMACLT